MIQILYSMPKVTIEHMTKISKFYASGSHFIEKENDNALKFYMYPYLISV